MMTREIKRGRCGGFTLVELLIAVAVFAILTAIAYPMYQDQVRKSRRAAVKGAMLQVSQFMERNFTETRSYNDAGGNTIALGDVFNSATSFIDADQRNTITRYYDLTLNTTGAGAGYTLTASPKGGQGDDKCATLSLDSVGNRASTSNYVCW